MRSKLFLLLLSLGLVGCREEATERTRLTLPPPDSEGVFPFSSNELFDLYRQDGKEANRLLKGKILRVTGRVVPRFTRIEPDPERLKTGERTPPDLYLHVDHQSNGFYVSSDGIICLFPERARETLRKRAKRLAQDDEVTVRGKLTGKLGSVFLEDCTLER